MDTPILSKLISQGLSFDRKAALDELAALKERLAEAERVIVPFAGKYNVLQAIGLTDSAMELAWPIDEPHLRAAAEWMKQK